MDRYEKGRVEEEGGLSAGNIPITALPQDHGWILVGDYSKTQNLVNPAIQSLKCQQSLVVAGAGQNANKVSSLISSVKRVIKNQNIYEIRKQSYRTIYEHWDPLEEDLSPLVVTRRIPTLHILLSLNEIDMSESDPIPAEHKHDAKKNGHGQGHGQGRDRNGGKRRGGRGTARKGGGS